MGFWPTGKALSSTNENNQGLITIGGCDLSLIERESLREHIALMSQQGHIFDASIADNLRLANHKATQEQMRKVCELVNLIDFIDSLPKGLDTWLGSTGIGLSGGQAQRLQIATIITSPCRSSHFR
eukprot:TRINITY_DN7273_c0_g1_i1.p1 TRINITY_DN7273_c0_g1~~TRINITY_DN7273_c0_g1_i1.p1  ORF type:complete len:126 (+),score=21.29 TRINITY_DN7273_c0_g1_i1:101-478(+)